MYWELQLNRLTQKHTVLSKVLQNSYVFLISQIMFFDSEKCVATEQLIMGGLNMVELALTLSEFT